MRTSEAALALITRINPQMETAYLTQWNEKWQAYSLIGGHREEGESFRDCCIREIAEELALVSENDFHVANEPLNGFCQYTAFSQSAKVMTKYRVQLFNTKLLHQEVYRKISSDPVNCWLTSAEITRMSTPTGDIVSSPVATVLALALAADFVREGQS